MYNLAVAGLQFAPFGLHPDLAQILCLELQTMLQYRNVEAETGNSDTTFHKKSNKKNSFKKSRNQRKQHLAL